jgi:hypothetical protein
LHETGTLRVYAPTEWLVGQDGGSSSISGQINIPNYWPDPGSLTMDAQRERPVPAVFLEAPIEVAIDLARRGWHRGYWVNADYLDNGICEALSSPDPNPGLLDWFQAVRSEGIRAKARCVCLYHPQLTIEWVTSLPFGVFWHIKANSVDQAEAQLDDFVNRCAAV